jgi:hypothetical protein
MNEGTRGSQPIEHHQSIGHWRKRGHCRGSIKTGGQRHHQRHSTNGQWQRPQKHR